MNNQKSIVAHGYLKELNTTWIEHLALQNLQKCIQWLYVMQ